MPFKIVLSGDVLILSLLGYSLLVHFSKTTFGAIYGARSMF